MPFDAVYSSPRLYDAAILRDARALIEQGWFKGGYYRDHKRHGEQYCAVAAIATALGATNYGRGPLTDHAELLVRELLREFPPVKLSFTNKGRLMRINDSGKTTKTHMLAGFDRAIARLESA